MIVIHCWIRHYPEIIRVNVSKCDGQNARLNFAKLMILKFLQGMHLAKDQTKESQ